MVWLVSEPERKSLSPMNFCSRKRAGDGEEWNTCSPERCMHNRIAPMEAAHMDADNIRSEKRQDKGRKVEEAANGAGMGENYSRKECWPL